MITIVKPGLLTTIQDLGRYGYQRYGVVVSGAMDSFSVRIANLLVGNDQNTPVLEITLIGPTLFFHEDTLISICGSDLAPTVEGKPVQLWRPVLIKKGRTLKFSICEVGCRTYLAVAGGFSVKNIMGSSATYIRGKMGGLDGRALQANDQLFILPQNEISQKILSMLDRKNTVSWKVPFAIDTNPTIRVVKGHQYNLFTKESQQGFFESSFQITSDADRMGYRLNGPPLTLSEKEEMISEAIVVGTIQVTPDGNTVILLADRQTTGGYPKIAQIISVDLPLLAHVKPGETLKFKEVTLAEAQTLFLQKEQYIHDLRIGIQLKYR